MQNTSEAAAHAATKSFNDDDTLNSRTIRVSPEEIIFANAVPGVAQTEILTLTNTLGVPIDVLLKCSNPDRLEVTPGKLRLEKSQSYRVEIKMLQQKPFHQKSTKLKDFLFIKGDYFDQKIQIVTYPGGKPSTLSSGSSLQRDNTINDRQCLTLNAGDSFGRAQVPTSQHKEDDDEADFLREKVTFLTNQNSNLQDQIAHLQNDLRSQTTNQIRDLLNQKDPNLKTLLDEALKQQQLKHERKEQKVLEILQYKDSQIASLQAKLSESDAQLQAMRETQSNFNKVHKALEDKHELCLRDVKSLQMQLAEKDELLQDFSQTDLATQKAQILELQRQLAKPQKKSEMALREELQLRKQQVDQLHEQKQKETQSLQRQIQAASQILSQVTGSYKQPIEKQAQDILQIVQKVQQEYQILESEMHNHMQQQNEATKDQSSITQDYEQLLRECQKLKEQLSDQAAELQHLRQHQKSSIGGVSSSDSQEHKNIFVQDTLQVSQGQGKLSHKMKEIKIRGDMLIDQVSHMKHEIQYQTSVSDACCVTDTDNQSQQMPADFWALRVGELEHLIYKQRDQIVALEEQKIEYKRLVAEKDTELHNRCELLELKNRNLMQPDNIFSSMLAKSPNDTDRFKADVQNFELKHRLQELEAQRDQLLAYKKQITAQCDDLQKELAALKSDNQLREVGLGGQETQLTLLIDDQKAKIAQLEQDLRSHALEHPVDMTLAGIRDEYITRVEALTQAMDAERQSTTQQLICQNQKIENYRAQLQHMEKREAKQNQEIDSLKDQLSQKQSASMAKKVEVESLIEAKNSQIDQLERDCMSKDRTLQERQEQLSVLLAAMDQSTSGQDLKQKLANMAADKCNLLADKSSLEQRLQHEKSTVRKTFLKLQRLQADFDSVTESESKTAQKLKLMQAQYEQAERKLHESDSKLLEQQNRLSDCQFNAQRQQFALKQKTDMITALQEQLRKQETTIQDSLGKIKAQLLSQARFETKTKDNSLRVAIQKLHLLILESDFDSSQVVQEMETTLGIAAQTIAQLQQELQVKSRECQVLSQEWDAFAQNLVLTQRYDGCLQRFNRYKQLIAQYDVDNAAFAKATIDQHLKSLIADVETRLDYCQKQCQSHADEISQLQCAKSQLQQENSQYKTQVAQFDEEMHQQAEQIRLKAEIDVDKRFKSKEETIKYWVESQLAGKELAMEVAALKLQQLNAHQVTQSEISQKETAISALKQAKSNLTESQSHIAHLNEKQSKLKKVHSQQLDACQKECEQLRKSVFALEKDKIRLAEQLQCQKNEVALLRIKIETQEDDSSHQPVHTVDLSRKVQELQEELIELRQNRMLEIDELRLQYELEVAEAKRGINLQQSQIQKSLGHEPGELVRQNQTMTTKLSQIQTTEIALREEVDYLRRHSQQLERANEDLKKDISDLKSSLLELDQVTELQESSKKSSKKLVAKPTEFDFVVQPPLLVKALVQAKLAEHSAKSKLRKQLHTEVTLRQQLSHKLQDQPLLSDLIDQNDTILQILNSSAEPEPYSSAVADTNGDYCGKSDDFGCLVQAVVALATQLARFETASVESVTGLHEVLPAGKVMQAQRVVIRSLQRKSKQQIRYVPEREHDRQIWLLELLEGQIIDAENLVQRLQDFIKRLQVGVSGNLQSAAEVKATSMDLCQNTKDTSEELKSLRHVAALIKHDIQQQASSAAAANPFNESTRDHQQMQSHRSIEKVMTERDSAQNQLSLTSKIKQSLEQELVSSKLSHATELQSHIQALKALQFQNQSLSAQVEHLQSANNAANTKLAEEQARCEDLCLRVDELSVQCEKAAKKVDASKGSQTSLRKLQADMQEWRKMSDHNLKTKQEALDEALKDAAKWKQDAQRLKSENLMLRRVQQDHRSGEETNQLLREIALLRDSLEQAEARTQEVQSEAEKEKQIIAEKLESLENLRTDKDNRQSDEITKVSRKLTTTAHELKAKLSEIVQLKDTIAQLQLQLVDKDTKLQTQAQSHERLSQKVESLQSKLDQAKEAQQDWAKERSQLMQLQEGSSQKIAQEMIDLRETFLKLKDERDCLKRELTQSATEFTRKHSELQVKLREMESQVTSRTQVTFQQDSQELVILQERNASLVNDLRYFKQQSETQQAKLSQLLDEKSKHDSNMLALEQELSAVKDQLQAKHKQLEESRSQTKGKEHQVRQLSLDLTEREAYFLEKLKDLTLQQAKMRHSYEVAQQSVITQLVSLKNSTVAQGGQQKPVKEVDTTLQLVQAQSLLKQAKKDLMTEKSKVSKLKAKKQELAQQIQDLSQKGKKPPVQAIPKWKEEIAELLSDSSQIKKVLKQLKDLQSDQSTILDLQHKCSESETQLYQQQAQTVELQSRIDSLHEAISQQKSSAKDGKQLLKEQYLSQISSLKETIKQLQHQISQIRKESVSVNDTQLVADQLMQAQQQLRQSQQEVARKNKLILSLRQSKDSLNQELDLVVADLKSLKDDNMRLQKALKDSSQRPSEVKEIRETNEWLQTKEKQLKDELQQMYEKNKALKADLQRQQTQLTQYREQCQQSKKEGEASQELTQVVQKLQGEKKRIKLELEIAHNQIKALKQQHCETKPTLETTGNHHQELQRQKTRAKRAEQSLKKSVSLLQRLGHDIQRHQQQASQSSGAKLSSHDYASEHLREAQDILGVSLNELEDFVACSTPGKSQFSNTESRIAKKLASLREMPDTLDEDIDEIGEYCCKFLEEIQHN